MTAANAPTPERDEPAQPGRNDTALTPRRRFATWLAPDEFAAREWRRLARPRHWGRGVQWLAGGLGLFLITAMLLVLLLPGGWLPSRRSTWLFRLSWFAYVFAPPVLAAFAAGLIWFSSSFQRTLADLAPTTAGAWPYFRARWRIGQSVLTMLALTLPVVATSTLLLVERPSSRFTEEILSIPLILGAEGGIHLYYNVTLWMAALLITRSFSRAAPPMVLLTVLTSGFPITLLLEMNFHTFDDFENAVPFFWAFLAVKTGLGMWFSVRMPVLLESYLPREAEGLLKEETPTAGKLERQLLLRASLWRMVGFLSILVILTKVGQLIASLLGTREGWISFMMLGTSAAWGLAFLLSRDVPRSAFTYALPMVIIVSVFTSSSLTGMASWPESNPNIIAGSLFPILSTFAAACALWIPASLSRRFLMAAGGGLVSVGLLVAVAKILPA